MVDLLVSIVKSTYYPYKLDPEASGVNSLTIDWSFLRFFALPPFSIIPKDLKKLRLRMQTVSLLYHSDQINHGFLLYWKWWLMYQFPLILGNIYYTYPQHPQTTHHIRRKIDLLACHLAGFSQKTAGYLKKLQASFKQNGDPKQGKDFTILILLHKCNSYM